MLQKYPNVTKYVLTNFPTFGYDRTETEYSTVKVKYSAHTYVHTQSTKSRKCSARFSTVSQRKAVRPADGKLGLVGLHVSYAVPSQAMQSYKLTYCVRFWHRRAAEHA